MKTFNWFPNRVILFLFFYPSLAHTQIGSIPEVGFGSRGLSLGHSSTSSSHDALSISWNPASVAKLKKITATVFYSKFNFDVVNSSYGIVIPSRRYGNFGFSFFRIDIDEITLRDEVGETQKKGSYRHSHLLFTYGRDLLERLAIGLNVKFVEQNFAGMSATLENPGIDLGMSYHFSNTQIFLKNFVVGFAIDNFVKPSLNFDSFSQALPREARVIAEKTFELGDGKLTLVSNVGFSKYNFTQTKTQFHGGIEYSHQSILALRAGLYESQFSAGVGLQFRGLIIDYARNKRQQIESNGLSSSINALTLTYQF